MSRAVMQKALDALESFQKISEFTPALVVHAIADLRAELAKPEQEPVATVIKKGAERQWMSERLQHLPDGIYSLYAAPPQRQRLTDEEIDELWCQYPSDEFGFARAIEAKLKENT